MKNLIFLSLFILIACERDQANNADPEAEGLTYIKTIGTGFVDVGRSIENSTNDNFVISGWTEDPSRGVTRDMWLLNIDTTGEVNWNTVHGDNNNDWAYHAVQTSDGGYIMSGRSSSKASPFSAVGSVSTMSLLKTDANGNEQWFRVYGNIGTSRIVYKVFETQDNGFIALALYTNPNPATNVEGSPWIYVFKTDANGNQLWSYEHGTWSSGYSIIETAAGEFIITGQQEIVRETFEVLTNAGSNVLVIKLAANGQLMWQREYDYSPWDIGRSIKKSTNGYVITGQVGSYVTSDKDVLLMEIDDAGNELWQQSYGGDYSDYGSDLIVTADNEFIVAANTNSYDSGNGDVWLLKAGVGGDLIWDRIHGSSEVDIARGLIQAPDGGFMIVGETESYDARLTDLLLIKTDVNGRVKLD